MKRASIVVVIWAIWLANGLAVSVAEPDHVISVLLKTGKESNLEEPYSRASLDCGDFTLESELNLIDKVLPAQSGGWEIDFNNGETLLAKQVSGEITYEVEFGQAKLPWSSIQKMTTARNAYKQREVGNFSRDDYKFKTRLKFRGGTTRITYLSKGDLALSVKYKGMNADLSPSRAHLVFDWPKQVVRASAQSGSPVDVTIARLPEGKSSAWTDLGEISFVWSNVTESQPVDGDTELFDRSWSVRFSDGTTLMISAITHRCSDWSSHQGRCLSLNGRAAEEVFWQQVSKIRMTENESAGTVTFTDGKESRLSADLLQADWAQGTIEIPFSATTFSEIVSTKSAVKTPNDKAYSQLIRFTDRQEWVGNLEDMNGFSETTASGVLHLLGLPVPLGTWLAESDALDLAISETQLFVRALGRSYPVKQADLEQRLTIETLHGRFRVVAKEVKSIQPIRTGTSSGNDLSVSVALRDGEKQELLCARIQFVRYPDRIWIGTMYDPSLGAWFWRQYDSITVKSGDSTTDVQLSRVKKLKFSGSYPSWDVEVEGTKTGVVLKGQMTPAEVAAQSPGVSSWDKEEEGFWFWSPGGRAYLFIPIARIGEINVSSGSK